MVIKLCAEFSSNLPPQIRFARSCGRNLFELVSLLLLPPEFLRILDSPVFLLLQSSFGSLGHLLPLHGRVKPLGFSYVGAGTFEAALADTHDWLSTVSFGPGFTQERM